MSFRPDSVRGAPTSGTPGVIDYRLARNSVVAEFGRGRLSRLDVCDAHPELVRAARNVGDASPEPCPICSEAELVNVTYVFGSGLPASGRCVTSKAELAKLNRRSTGAACYVVEVCRSCSWNHLLRTFPIGGSRARQPS